MQKKSFPWAIIILAFFLFFPVGILMLVRKMTVEKYYYINNGKKLRIFAWVLISIAILYLIMGISGELKTEDGSNAVGAVITMLVIFGGGGAFALYKAQSYIKKGTKYNRYVAIVNSGNNTLIDNIAAAYPTSFEQAAKDLQSMIDDGYILNSYIDLNRRELIMPRKAAGVKATVNQSAARPAERPTSVKCKNCGAINSIVSGTANECEYCGSPL